MAPIVFDDEALLARLATETPPVRYVKVEVPHTAEELLALSAAAGPSLPGLFDGEEGITFASTWADVAK